MFLSQNPKNPFSEKCGVFVFKLSRIEALWGKRYMSIYIYYTTHTLISVMLVQVSLLYNVT